MRGYPNPVAVQWQMPADAQRQTDTRRVEDRFDEIRERESSIPVRHFYGDCYWDRTNGPRSGPRPLPCRGSWGRCSAPCRTDGFVRTPQSKRPSRCLTSFASSRHLSPSCARGVHAVPRRGTRFLGPAQRSSATKDLSRATRGSLIETVRDATSALSRQRFAHQVAAELDRLRELILSPPGALGHRFPFLTITSLTTTRRGYRFT